MSIFTLVFFVFTVTASCKGFQSFFPGVVPSGTTAASTITLLFLLFAVVSFILEKIPLGLTATIVALGLNLTNVLTVKETFAGYVNSNVILCVGMFVVGQALFETGMANKIGGIVTKFTKSEKILIIAIMLIVGIMSGFLSNTGTAAVLILLSVE